MTNDQMLNEIRVAKITLTNLQVKSNAHKTKFFDYIEGLSSEYKLLENINRDDFSFEIFGNKLNINSTYDSTNSSFQGKFSIMVQIIINGVITFNELCYFNFDMVGNIYYIEEGNPNSIFSCDNDFLELLYCNMIKKIIKINRIEL